jgi:hypothetical protein
VVLWAVFFLEHLLLRLRRAKPVQNALNKLSIDNQIGAVGKNVKDNLDPLEALKAEARKYKSVEEFADSLNAMNYGKVTGVGELPIEKINKTQIKALTERGLPHTDTNMKVSDFKPGRKVTQPLEVYSKGGSWVVENGNHRLAQALANGDKTVPVVFKGGEGKKYSTAIADLYNQATQSRNPFKNQGGFAKNPFYKDPQVGKTDGLRDVPIADFKNTDTTSWNEAIQNVGKGKLSKTNGPVEVVLTKNGYKLVEGNHRAVQALNNGDTTIRAKVISKEGLDEIAKRDGPHIKMGMQDSYTQKQLDDYFNNSTPVAQVGKTVSKNIDDLKGNGQAIEDKELTQAIKENGVTPLLVDENGNLFEGHHRLESLKALGVDSVPTQPINLAKFDKLSDDAKMEFLDNYNLNTPKVPVTPQVGKTEPTIKAYHGSTNNKLSSLEPGAKTGLNEKRNLIYLTEDKTSASHYAKTRGTDGTGLGILSDSKTGKVYETEVTGKIIDAYNRDGGLSELKNAKGFDQLSGKTKNQLTNDTGLSGDILESNPELVKFLKDNNITAVRGHLNNTSDGATELMVVNPDKAKLAPQVGKTEGVAPIPKANQRVIESAATNKPMNEFRVGERVSFGTAQGGVQSGTITKTPDFTKDLRFKGNDFKVKLDDGTVVKHLGRDFKSTTPPKGVAPKTPQVGKTGATTGKYSAQSAADRIQNQTAEMPQKPNTQLEQPEVPNKMQAKGSGDNASYLDDTPELPKYNTKKVGLLDKAFRSTRSIIERQGESGKKLAGMLQQQRDSKELWLRDIEKRLPNVQKLKDKEFENFIETTQGNASPMNLKVADAVKEWKSVHPEIRQRGVDAGLDIGDLGENYYPHFIDYEKVFKNQNTYNEAINHLVKTGQAPTQEEAIKLLSYARDISRNRQFGNLEASRIVDLPFYDKSKKSLATYLQGSADRITKTELFGKGDEKAIKLIKNIAVEGGDTEAAKNAFDVAVGAKQYNPTASKISGGIRHYTTVTRLGLGALTNLSQSVNTGIVTGHLRTLGAVAKQLSPKARQFAEDTGVISDAILDDIKRGVGYESFGSSAVGKGVNFITAPGFKQVEAFNRRVAATAGKDYALRLAQKGDEATLRKLGVTGAIKNNTLTDAQQIQAARKIVEKTQFKVDPQDLPGWADSPGGKLVAQFRTFSYNQGKFFSNEILKPLAKGNVMPLGRMLAALPLGYALYETRRRIDGRPEEENKNKVALSSFQKIGGAGLALDIYQGLNPLGSQYLPSDRRVSLATSVFGGPSIGTATNLIGSVSDVIQRKNTPSDESKLGGKVALFNNGDKYTDATSIARFGMQQIPIVGSPIMNRVLPYKKSAEADAGKATQSSTPQLSLDDQRTEAKNTVKKLYGKEWASMSETDIADKARNGDQKALEIYNSLQAQEKVYAKPNMPTPGLSKDAEDILNSEKKFTTTGRKAWGNRQTESKVVKDTLKSWTGVDLPVTNDVAVDWAKFKQKQAKGEFSPLEENEAKLSLARKAVSSQLSEDERQYYNVADDKLLDALSKGWIKPDSLAKAMDIDKQLLSMGLTSKSGFGKKIWNALGISYPSVSGASSGTRRSSGRRLY